MWATPQRSDLSSVGWRGIPWARNTNECRWNGPPEWGYLMPVPVDHCLIDLLCSNDASLALAKRDKKTGRPQLDLVYVNVNMSAVGRGGVIDYSTCVLAWGRRGRGQCTSVAIVVVVVGILLIPWVKSVRLCCQFMLSLTSVSKPAFWGLLTCILIHMQMAGRQMCCLLLKRELQGLHPRVTA